jgi:hypothetical protein
MRTAGDVHEMYEMSLQVEPREREDEKIARYHPPILSPAPGKKLRKLSVATVA